MSYVKITSIGSANLEVVCKNLNILVPIVLYVLNGRVEMSGVEWIIVIPITSSPPLKSPVLLPFYFSAAQFVPRA